MNWIMRGSRRVLRHLMAAVSLVGVATLNSAALPAASPPAAHRPLTVTFTFDDGVSDQAAVGRVFGRHHLAATVYVSSSLVGQPGYLTRQQLKELADHGQEIGGHTVSHQNLITLDPGEQNRQICQDRDTLLSWGFDVTSFAYPFADLDRGIEATAQRCGYNSARAVGRLLSPGNCPTCDRTEPVPPVNPYAIRTPGDVDNTWTLEQLKNLVTGAEPVGGWLPLNLHHVCAGGGCPVKSIAPDLLDAFLCWLTSRADRGTTVRTVAQVIGGTAQPAVDPVAPPAPGAPGVNTVRNPSLETPNPLQPTVPDCFTVAGYGTNTATHTRVSDAHTGAYASRLEMTARTDGDAKLVPRQDLGQCANQVRQGHAYEVSAWYKADVPVFFSLYWRNAVGQWSYWTQSPRLGSAAAWTRAAWVTPAPPAGSVAVSFGLTLDSVGRLTTDDYGFADNQAGPAPDGVNALTNPSLETPGADGVAQCWTVAGYGTNNAVWTRVTDAADGTYAENVRMTSRVDGDTKLVAGWDSGKCAPLVTPGKRLALSVAYHATVPTFFTVYRQDGAGNWSYWTQSPALPPSPTYAKGAWTTPAVPQDTRAVTFGLTLDRVGEATSDDYSLVSKP